MKKITFTALLIFGITQFSNAQDRLFNYTYQTNVLNKGQREIEVWTTVLESKTNFYREIKNRFEFEIGLGNHLQTSFYLNSKQKAEFEPLSSEIVMSATEISISNEWKYQFSNASSNAIGFAAYTEITVATDEVELEFKAIFDKKFGRHFQAFNLTFEPEWETTTKNGSLVTETAFQYQLNYGYAYQINKKCHVGLEVQNQYLKKEIETNTKSALFVGPTISYATEKFWANLSVLPQITGSKTIATNSQLNLEDYTKWSSRLIISVAF